MNIVDMENYCPKCDGRGVFRDPHPNEYGRTVTEKCYACDGSGRKTVIVTPRPTIGE